MAFLGRKKSPAATQYSGTPSAPASGDLFFGALRSEFDTPDSLSPAFSLAEEAFSLILDAYRSGRVDAREAGSCLSKMIITDHNGMQWTAGATTLRWYRRLPGGAWSSALPPVSDSETSYVSAEKVMGEVLTLLESKGTPVTSEPASSLLDAPVASYLDVEDLGAGPGAADTDVDYDWDSDVRDLFSDGDGIPEDFTVPVGEAADFQPAPPVFGDTEVSQDQAPSTGYGYGDDDFRS